MPVKKLVRSGPSPAAQALRDRLVNEWRHPDPAAQQPIILEESGGAALPVHVYVIWDDWSPLGSIERSEVIMDAYEEVHGRARSANVTVAMGLTPAEAERLGIRYSEIHTSDDRKKRRRAASSRINIHEDDEVQYWAKKFGVTAAQLKDCVKRVGVMASDVKKCLGT